MLNGKYDLTRHKQIAGNTTRILDEAGNVIVSIPVDAANPEVHNAMLQGIKTRILFDGGTLFDVANDTYLVGHVSQLMKKGR